MCYEKPLDHLQYKPGRQLAHAPCFHLNAAFLTRRSATFSDILEVNQVETQRADVTVIAQYRGCEL